MKASISSGKSEDYVITLFIIQLPYCKEPVFGVENLNIEQSVIFCWYLKKCDPYIFPI